jgi:hypothetical protein
MVKIIALAALAALGLAWWLKSFLKGSRRRALEGMSAGTGVYVEDYGPDLALLEGTGLPFFVDGRSGVGRMLLHFPEEDGVKSWYFDYSCMLGAGAGQKTRSATVALFEFAKGAYPDFHLSAGGDLPDETSGLEPVETSSVKGLPAGIKLFGRDAAQLAAYFNADRDSGLAAHSGWSVQGSGRYLLLYKGCAIIPPSKYRDFMQEAEKLAFNLS